MSELYPSAKPLPKVVRVELKERKIAGMVRVSEYNKRQFGNLFKKEKS